MNSNEARLTQAHLRTPRAAAVAGILFSVLLFAVYALMRLSVPGDPFEPGAWLQSGETYVAVAMNLVPFAGIAFLWFVGALRDRLGTREDQFFATVFLGSGFLLLAMLFSAAAVVGAIVMAFHAAPGTLMHFRDFLLRAQPGLRNGQHLPGKDCIRLHDYNIDHRSPHSFDAHLACGRRLRDSARAADWKLLFRLEPHVIPAVGSAGKSHHPDGKADRTTDLIG
jgi:hypothetical protein